jgi:hypothetical protein
MLFVCLFGVTLVVTTTTIHYEMLRLLNAGLPILQMPARAKLIVVILVEFATHTLEILLYAASYYALEYYFDAGTLGAPGQLGWLHYIYFSGETYTCRRRSPQRSVVDWLVSFVRVHSDGTVLARRSKMKQVVLGHRLRTQDRAVTLIP